MKVPSCSTKCLERRIKHASEVSRSWGEKRRKKRESGSPSERVGKKEGRKTGLRRKTGVARRSTGHTLKILEHLRTQRKKRNGALEKAEEAG